MGQHRSRALGNGIGLAMHACANEDGHAARWSQTCKAFSITCRSTVGRRTIGTGRIEFTHEPRAPEEKVVFQNISPNRTIITPITPVATSDKLPPCILDPHSWCVAHAPILDALQIRAHNIFVRLDVRRGLYSGVWVQSAPITCRRHERASCCREHSSGTKPGYLFYNSSAAFLPFFCSTLSRSARLMCGRTPPNAIVARINVSNSSSPRIAS